MPKLIKLANLSYGDIVLERNDRKWFNEEQLGNPVIRMENNKEEVAMADTAEQQHRGSRKKTMWHTQHGQAVEITERQKEIMKLSEELPNAQAVADKLGISPNAVYVSRRRVKEALEAQGDPPHIAPFADKKPRRVVPLNQYKGEQEGVNVDVEVREVASVVQQKLITLTEAEEYHQNELDKIARAKSGLHRMLENVLEGAAA